MATKRDLGPRVLMELSVLANGDTADANDIEVVEQKLASVHAFLRTEGLLRWTLNDIPDYAEEPYVLMAAFLAAPTFQRPADPGKWQLGLNSIQRAVALTQTTVTRAEYF